MLQDDITPNARTTSSASLADGASDVSSEDQASSAFRAHLKSFAYTSDSHSSRQANWSQSTRARFSTTNAPLSKLKSAMEVEPPACVRRSSRKRTREQPDNGALTREKSTDALSLPKKKRTTTKQRSAADPRNPVNKLVDSIRSGLTLVFIGLNPGLMTAATGHAYAHPSNLFWKLLESSGVTSRRHNPNETHDLMDLYSIGNTNICARPTRSGDGLSKEELIEGAGILEEKIAKHKPEAVCIVGKGIWDVIYKTKTGKPLKTQAFTYGWQDEELWLGRIVNEDGLLEWAGAKTFVTTSTSGLAAGMKPHEKLAIWKPLGDWVQKQRAIVLKSEINVKAEECLD